MTNKNTVPAEFISIVVPVLNEAKNIDFMVDEIASCMSEWNFEMIFVDDFSSDDTVARLTELKARHPELRCLCHSKRCGQSAAIRTGVLNASGAIIATLDGDGQNPPHELPRLIVQLLNDKSNVALVQGQRERRMDTKWKKWASKIANAIRRGMLNDSIQDSGCGLKSFKRDAYLSLPYFDHIHRFMPAMMLGNGFGVGILPVSHEERKSGVSKYGNLDRALAGAWDLLGVIWLLRRSSRSEAREVFVNHENTVSDIRSDGEEHTITS